MQQRHLLEIGSHTHYATAMWKMVANSNNGREVERSHNAVKFVWRRLARPGYEWRGYRGERVLGRLIGSQGSPLFAFCSGDQIRRHLYGCGSFRKRHQ
ncbi:unnamed protein product [Victoria cruziana]